MLRRVRRFGRRTSRPRTRWLAVTPGTVSGASGPGAGTYNYANILLEDRTGAVSLSEFYGGTLLRLILDVQIQHTINNAGGIQTATNFMHAGVFLSTDSPPSATVWDPNKPSGDFMERKTFGEEVALQYGTGQYWYRGLQDGFAFHFDTNVKRRIVENSFIFMSVRGFLGGTAWTGVDLGFTGRALIRLP